MWIVALVIVLGFKKSWKWIVLMGIIVDIISFSFLGKNVLIFVLGAYLVDQMLRLLVFERQNGARAFVFFVLVLCMTLFCNFVMLVWPENGIYLSNLKEIFQGFWFFVSSIFFQAVLNIMLLYAFYILIKKFEKGAEFYSGNRV
jgi:cell shape-determining protein MreD